MSREKGAFGKRRSGPGAASGVGGAQIKADTYDRYYRPLLLVALIGGLPFHFLLFPFGIIAQSVLFVPFFWLHLSNPAQNQKSLITLTETTLFLYFGFFIGVSVIAYNLPNFMPHEPVEYLGQWIKWLLSLTPYADGMWSKLNHYQQNYQADYHHKYLFFSFAIILFGPCYWALSFIFSKSSKGRGAAESDSETPAGWGAKSLHVTGWEAFGGALLIGGGVFYVLWRGFVTPDFLEKVLTGPAMFPRYPENNYWFLIFPLMFFWRIIVCGGVCCSYSCRRNF